MATPSGSRTISSQAVQEWAEGSTTTSVGNADIAKLLIAVALGDGHLKPVSPTSALLCIGHSAKQRDYLEHKASILNRALGSDNPVKARKTHNRQNGKTYETCQWWTPSLPSLLGLRNLLYLEGKKVLSRPLLEYGGLLALAYYFMDDGSLYLRYRKSASTGVRQLRERHVTLAVCDVADRCEMVADWIESLTGVRMFLKKYNTSVDKWILRADGRGAAGIIAAIGHLFPDCMQHKADLCYSSCGRGKSKWSEPQPLLESGR